MMLYKLLVFGWNTWNYTTVCKVFVLDWNTWYPTTASKHDEKQKLGGKKCNKTLKWIMIAIKLLQMNQIKKNNNKQTKSCVV